MRTRIALVATLAVAVITITVLTQVLSEQSAQAGVTSAPRTATTATTGPSLLSHVSSLLLFPPTTKAPTPPAPPAPAPAPAAAPAQAPTGPVDTVTPIQRVEWERVAMCEEGGDWSSDGSRFSGGLGITRTNWDAYGGLAYAPEGAMATEDEQIMVAEHIQYSPPDQGGCHGW